MTDEPPGPVLRQPRLEVDAGTTRRRCIAGDATYVDGNVGQRREDGQTSGILVWHLQLC
jgi:hypothetical protein